MLGGNVVNRKVLNNDVMHEQLGKAYLDLLYTHAQCSVMPRTESLSWLPRAESSE